MEPPPLKVADLKDLFDFHSELNTIMERLQILSARLASTWALKSSASVLSVGALAALVSVLMAANWNDAEDWHWHSITLNAIVSVLSTISRLSALHVLSAAIGQTKWILASRGSGSLRILRRSIWPAGFLLAVRNF